MSLYDTITEINDTIEQKRKEPGEASLTLIVGRHQYFVLLAIAKLRDIEIDRRGLKKYRDCNVQKVAYESYLEVSES